MNPERGSPGPDRFCLNIFPGWHRIFSGQGKSAVISDRGKEAGE